MIVVDTTIWIDFLNGRDLRHVDTLATMISEDVELGITDVILTEILQGVGDPRDAQRTEQHLADFPVLRLRHLDDFRFAADLYRTARHHGVTIRSTIDTLIASVCIREDTPLFHNDRDYDLLATCTPLRIYRPERPSSRPPRG